jgi:FdhE protein
MNAESAPLGASIPPLRLPHPGLLLEARAGRLAALAAEAGGDPFLAFLGRLAAAQRAALPAVSGVARPRGQGRPLDADAFPADPALAPVLAAVLAAVRGKGLPAPAEAAIRGLGDAGPPALERLAVSVLAAEVRPEELAAAPFVGAALQVVATARAARLDPADIPRAGSGCPVCGSPPVAGVVQGDDRLRYLTCALCAAEWHLARIHCALCLATAGVGYHHLEHDASARAETCEACKGYVKLFDLEKRPGADPLADDAATLALDLLLGEAGYHRGGSNPLLPASG